MSSTRVDVIENTSGMGGGWPVPEEVDGLNWGAFLLPVFWAFGNKAWGYALLSFVPGIAFFIRFVLLFSGSSHSWRFVKWRSIEHFQKAQRQWLISGLLFYALILVLCLGLSFVGNFRS